MNGIYPDRPIARYLTHVEALGSVETWFDRNGRNWVTQARNANGDQCGAAYHSGTRFGAENNHIDMVRTHLPNILA